MGANGSYDKKTGGVPAGRRTHIETGHKILGHKVLLQEGVSDQTKNIMNSNSESPIYLMAKKNPDGSLTVLNINDFSGHKIGLEINLKYDQNGNVKPFNGKEANSHSHEWHQVDNGDMHRKPTEGNSHLPIPDRYSELISEIQKFNKQKNTCKK